MLFISLFHFPTLKNQLTRSPRSPLANQRGQGLIEYLVIVALMGVATIAIVRVMGQTVSTRFANITESLQGKSPRAKADSIDASSYKKKDLGDFFHGVNGRGGSSPNSGGGTGDGGFWGPSGSDQ